MYRLTLADGRFIILSPAELEERPLSAGEFLEHLVSFDIEPESLESR